MKLHWAAKSDKPHPKLPGTIHSVAKEVQATGGNALAIKLDVRDVKNVAAAIEKAFDTFGGIDALINNARAIFLQNTQNTPLKLFDLIYSINTRGTLVCCQAAIPHLRKFDNPYIITLSPPLNPAQYWLGRHIPYTITKYSMSLTALGLAEELREAGITSNTFWSRTTMAIAAVGFAIDARILKASRTPAIMVDAAYEILNSDSKLLTGRLIIDETLLLNMGVSNFDHYKNDPTDKELQIDIFVD